MGEGSRFIVDLPIVNEVNDSQVNTHSNQKPIAMEIIGIRSQSMEENVSENIEVDVSSSAKQSILVIEDKSRHARIYRFEYKR